jgi:uncharacterized protein YkwD
MKNSLIAIIVVLTLLLGMIAVAKGVRASRQDYPDYKVPHRSIPQHQVVIVPEHQRPSLIESHNRIRRSQGLSPLVEDPQLTEIAQRWAQHMARTRVMRHQILSVHMKGWKMLGENIAKGQTSIDEVMKDWMNSRGHRENILKPNYNRIGVGTARAKDGTLFWCVDFGQR